MGNSCFRGNNTSEKNPAEDLNSAKQANQGTELPIAFLNVTKIDCVEEPKRFTITSTGRMETPYEADRNDNKSCQVFGLSTVSSYLTHRDFKVFESVFQESVAALSLRSCEGASMPHHLIVGGEDGSIVFINYQSGETIRRWSRAHTRDVNFLTRPITSGIFASASRDTLVKIWHLQNDKPLCTLHGHKASVTGVTMCFDDTHLVSGSRDNTVRLWDVRRAEELACSDIKQNVVHFVKWVTQLQCVAQGGEDLTLRLWDVRMSSGDIDAVRLGLGTTLSCMDYHPICCELAADSTGCILLTGHNGFNGHGAYVMEWDLRMLRYTRTFHGHKGTVRSISNCATTESSHQQFVTAGDDAVIAFFSTNHTNYTKEVFANQESISKLPEGPVTSLDACGDDGISASMRSGAIMVFRPTLLKTGITVPVERFRYFGTKKLLV